MEPMNQGVRNGIHPCGSAAATRQMLRDLFHPDYDRRPWHLTRSADPAGPDGTAGARGLLQSMPCMPADTAGGELHPALRTLLCGEGSPQDRIILATVRHNFWQ